MPESKEKEIKESIRKKLITGASISEHPSGQKEEIPSFTDLELYYLYKNLYQRKETK